MKFNIESTINICIFHFTSNTIKPNIMTLKISKFIAPIIFNRTFHIEHFYKNIPNNNMIKLYLNKTITSF